MAYFLIAQPNTTQEKSHQLKSGNNRIGRSPDNDIVVLHGSLSRYHAQLKIAGDQFILSDLGSLNGTCVNGVKVSKAEVKKLKNGDQLACGNVVFQFVAKPDTPSQPPQPPQVSPPEHFSIIKQIAPEQNRIVMGDILDQGKKGYSVLKLRGQSTEERTVDKLKILLEVTKQLICPRNSEKLLDKILDLLMEIMNIDRAVLLMRDNSTGKLERKALKVGEDIECDEHFYSRRITKYVCEHGQAVLTGNAGHDFGSHSVISQAIQAAMCVPLKPGDRVIGVLYVDNLSVSNVYTTEDLEFLTALANQAAVAIENVRLSKQMRESEVKRNKLENFFPPAVSRKILEEGAIETVDRDVTVLFSDISGFTKMTSTMEPSKVIEMLNDYFQVMVEEIVFCYEGTLEKYIGDALLAVWGAPYPQEDQVERAIKAAVDMQRAILRLNNEWQQQGRKPINIHIGINSGPVAAGNIGSEKMIQYATIGNTTNVTSRICDVAKAGEIVISQPTYEQLNRNSFPCEVMEPVMVKGKEHPLQLYRLLWDKVEPFATSKI